MTSELQQKQLLEEESAWLEKRTSKSNKTLTGLALSGGGIRSATFNLGVLQALEKHQILKNVDITSSVSGGGYIASCLSWFQQKKGQFPFGTQRQDHGKLGGAVLAWLRSHACFLTPGDGINKLSLFTALFTGTFINLFILLPLFIGLFFLLAIDFSSFQLPLKKQHDTNLFGIATLLGFSGIGLCIVLMICAALSTRLNGLKNQATEKIRYLLTKVTQWSIFFIIIGHLPLLHDKVESFTDKIAHGSVTVSIVSALLSLLLIWRGDRTEKGQSIGSVILVKLLIYTFCLSVFIFTYHLARYWLIPEEYFLPLPFILWTLTSVVLALLCDINLISMHGYYRNRLRDTFMPTDVPKTDGQGSFEIAEGGWQESQLCYLAQFTQNKGPYHIINCNVELVDSKHPKYKNRNGDNFTFTPVMSGSSATGYISTKRYMSGKVDLASVTAISGAAVATNTSHTQGVALNFIMALFNLRLGCWYPNPKATLAHKERKPLWYHCIFRDMFGKGLDENRRFIHLSDGGHFENLGAYELFKRKAKLIISIDAGADPDFKFHDLAKLTELIRVDFGAKLALDTSPLVPDGKGFSQTAWVIGDISYEDGSKGKFIYVKSAMLTQLSPDIVGYKHENPTFPDQTTADQFFDEYQFEAYRELGFQITHRMLTRDPAIKELL